MFEKIRTILSILSVLPTLIRSVEEALPGDGVGEQKLEMVRRILTTSLEVAGTSVNIVEGAWVKIVPLVSSIVSQFNELGVFTKGGSDNVDAATAMATMVEGEQAE